MGHAYAWILLCLTSLFMVRVAGQLVQALHPVGVLPAFEAWQSGALPYPVLLGSQMVILGCCLRVVWRLFKRLMVPAQKTGKILLFLGGLYFLVMSIRVVVGLTVAPDHFWFGAKLPTIFHFVLSAFLLVYGWFHASVTRPAVPVQEEANG